MNKPLGVLVGIVVIAGVLNTAGAWYTGTKIEGELKTSIEEANTELAAQLAGSATRGSIELVSIETHLYTSTAHYRLKIQDDAAATDPQPVELLFVDHIEHGPLPWSRIKTFKWAPVMAVSNYALEKTPFTEKWFAATKDQPPLKGQLTLSYSRAVDGQMELLPFDVTLDDKTSISFSGLNLNAQSDDGAQHLKGKGYMDFLKLHAIPANTPPVSIELSGLTLASDLTKSAYGFYLGQNVLELSEAQLTSGAAQSVFKVKNFEYTGSASAKDRLLSGRLTYSLGDVTFNDKPVGSAEMVMSASNVDIPAMQSLLQIYQTKFQPQADGTMPKVQLTPAEDTQVQADLGTLLAAKPNLALEKLHIKTPHGESQLSLATSLAQPASFELPPLDVLKQTLTSLDAKLQLSKPMIADLVSVQAQLAGQIDPEGIAQMANMTSELAAVMAVQTGLATVDGNNILASLNYAAGQVEFNGEKMSLKDFINRMGARLGGIAPL